MRYLALIVLGLLISPAVSFGAAFNTNLYYGISSPDVSALQEFLTDQGVYTGPISGNFYALTLAGVKKFQAANNISPVSGYFGILSRGVANSLLVPIEPIEETGTTTSVIEPAPQVAPVAPTSPVQPSSSPVQVSPSITQNTPVQPSFGAIASCDSTPAISITFSQPSIDIETSADLRMNAYTNVVDGCGKLYPYNIYAGGQPRKTGFNITGTTTTDISIGQVWQWEVIHPDTLFPVEVDTKTSSSTEYVQVNDSPQ